MSTKKKTEPVQKVQKFPTKFVVVSVKCSTGDYKMTLEVARDADVMQQVIKAFEAKGHGGRILKVEE